MSSERKITSRDVVTWIVTAPFILAVLPVFLMVRLTQAGWYACNAFLGRWINTY